jgi:hypothetical protein
MSETPLDPTKLRPTSIVALIDDLVTRAYPVARKYRDIATINESFIHDDQWGAVIRSNGVSSIKRDAWFDDDGVPRIWVNLMAPLWMTWASLMTKDAPSVQPVAASDEPEDSYRAEVASKIIDYLEDELDTSNVIHKAVGYAGMHGLAGIKIIYDTEKDAIDWSPLTIFNVYTDPRVPDYRKSPYFIFEDYVGEEEAYQLLGDNAPKPRTQGYKNAAGEQMYGVRKRELWLKPTRDYPKGLYACEVAGEVVEEMPYPNVTQNDSGKLEYFPPCVLMKVRDIRDSAYGGTNFTAAVPLQRAYNEIVARTQKLIRTVTNIHLRVPQSIEKKVKQEESTLIAFPDDMAMSAEAIGYTKAGEISSALPEERDFFEAAMAKVVGVNEVTAGNETRSISGRAIENIVELDRQKNADASREMLSMIREAYRITLKLIARYYTVPRQVRITNEDGASVVAFDGSDIVGIDIKLEPATELDKLSTAKEEAAEKKLAAGTGSPLDVAKAGNRPGYGLSLRMAQDIVSQYLATGALDAGADDVNPQILSEVIEKQKAHALAKMDRMTWSRLQRLKKEVAGLAARADQASPQPPAAPPPPARGAPMPAM